MLQEVIKEELNDEALQDAEHRGKRFQLAKLLRCTEEMLNCAQKGDWDSVEELELSRKKDLSACFSDTTHEESPVIIEALATLVFLNRQITKLVADAKQEVIAKQQAAKNDKAAISHYKQNY